MPGQHRDLTISFRATQWERAMIEERVVDYIRKTL